MKSNKKLSLMVMSLSLIFSAYAEDKTVKFVANSMHCGGCANKVKTAVKALDGVKDAECDLESKVVSITYDDAQATPAQIKEAIATAKGPAEDYNPEAVIAREVQYYAKQINCGGCAAKVKKNLGAEAGIISVEADPETKIVTVNYDANKVSQKEFKDFFGKFDYTVTRYYDSDKVKYTRYAVASIGAKAEDVKKSLKELKGVLDYSINAKTNTVAIAYNASVVNEDALAQAVVKDNNLTLASN